MKNEWQRHVAASFSITPTTTSNHSAYVPSRARRIYRRFIRRKIPSSHPLILRSGTMMETRSNNSLIPFSSVSLPASPLHLEIFVAQFASSEFVPRGIFITGESFFAKEFLKVFSFHRSHFAGEFLSHLKQGKNVEGGEG